MNSKDWGGVAAVALLAHAAVAAKSGCCAPSPSFAVAALGHACAAVAYGVKFDGRPRAEEVARSCNCAAALLQCVSLALTCAYIAVATFLSN